jgi:glycosyltransferase involved in cell wall biosynthesis
LNRAAGEELKSLILLIESLAGRLLSTWRHMRAPVVSVVVPNFNYGHFLQECIESVLDQNFPDYEVIVVDDNSEDNSREIVRGYVSRYPDRISLLHNSAGPSGTPTPINMGIRYMRGQYFAWLSSDDVFERDKLANQVSYLQEHPSVGLVHSAYIAIDDKGAKIGEFHPPNEFGTDAFTALLDGNFINGNTVLIPRRVLDAVGPLLETDTEFPELWRAAEYYHWLKIALRYPIACIDRLLHRTRRHAGNEEYQSSAMGTALERVFIRRCFEEHNIPVTPEIVAALGSRGLMTVFIRTFDRLSAADRAHALDLFRELENDQDRWDLGMYEGVRKLDVGRIRSAFHSKNARQAQSMLRALEGLDRPETKPYQAAAKRRLLTSPV